MPYDTDPEVIMARARRGFEWAMSNHPDRLAGVDPDILDIRHFFNCVGGQMFGGFSTFQVETGLTPREQRDLGFIAEIELSPENEEEWMRENAALTLAWQQLLRGDVDA